MYSRKIDGQILHFAASGWTYKNVFVLYDLETSSLWYPNWRGLKSIQGVYAGRVLGKITFEDTTWREWLSFHPDTLLLK